MKHFTERLAGRLLAAGLAAALLAAPLPASGFPVTDWVASAQRLLDKIEQQLMKASLVQQTMALAEQVSTAHSQLQQSRRAAEGLVGRVQGWQRMMASYAGVLGSPADTDAWARTLEDISLRAARIQRGEEAQAPAADDERDVWNRRPEPPPLGRTPPIVPPAGSRADLAAQFSAAIAARNAEDDGLLARAAAALQRSSEMLEQSLDALGEVKGNTETSVTALQQKQQALTGTISDLLVAGEQREALREERDLAERAARRAAVAQLQTQALAGVERLFEEAAFLRDRYDAAGADAAMRRPALPTY